jgi:hypothetical protein
VLRSPSLAAEADPLAGHLPAGWLEQELDRAVVDGALVVAGGVGLLGPGAGEDLAVGGQVLFQAADRIRDLGKEDVRSGEG